jgi:hypothetical protein
MTQFYDPTGEEPAQEKRLPASAAPTPGPSTLSPEESFRLVSPQVRQRLSDETVDAKLLSGDENEIKAVFESYREKWQAIHTSGEAETEFARMKHFLTLCAKRNWQNCFESVIDNSKFLDALKEHAQLDAAQAALPWLQKKHAEFTLDAMTLRSYESDPIAVNSHTDRIFEPGRCADKAESLCNAIGARVASYSNVSPSSVLGALDDRRLFKDVLPGVLERQVHQHKMGEFTGAWGAPGSDNKNIYDEVRSQDEKYFQACFDACTQRFAGALANLRMNYAQLNAVYRAAFLEINERKPFWPALTTAQLLGWTANLQNQHYATVPLSHPGQNFLQLTRIHSIFTMAWQGVSLNEPSS